MSPDSKETAQLYGQGYFHGENSGYPKSGYATVRPSWKAYVEFLLSVKGPGIHWLDLGCAYGYLLQETEGKAISAFGLDISPYALQQVESVRPRLIRGGAQTLPFSDAAFDVVSAFDLLEHLPEPTEALDEITRVLKPGGVLVFSTPDPILFRRPEPTHISEHPPSFWMDQVQKRGLRAVLRFFGEPYNLEILAVKDGPEPAVKALFSGFNRDYFGNRSDIVAGSTEEHPVVLRGGWQPLEENDPAQGVRQFYRQASLYFFNGGLRPAEVSLTFELDRSVPLRLHTQLENIGVDQVVIRPDQSAEVTSQKFYLAPGGHDLDIVCDENQAVAVTKISVQCSEIDQSPYNLALPADQYQRYRMLQDIVHIIREDGHPLRILEVGGTPGQIRGFLPDDDITIVDLEPCDIPNFRIADALHLPFSDRSFEVVASLDVLEHIGPADRAGFLAELTRVSSAWVVVGAPFADPALQEAERILAEFIHTKLQYTHRFLEEHLSQALPNREETAQLLDRQGFQTVVLPNGYLSHWLMLMLVHFYLETDPRLNRVKRFINQYYNQYHYGEDNCAPAYRHVIIGAGMPGAEKKLAALRQLVSPGPNRTAVNLTPAALLLQLTNLDLLREKDFLLNQKDTVLQDLATHAGNLDKAIGEKDKVIQSLSDGLKKLEKDVRELETRLLASLEQNSYLIGRIGDLEAGLDHYFQHSQNLEKIVNHPMIRFLRACKHILPSRKPQ